MLLGWSVPSPSLWSSSRAPLLALGGANADTHGTRVVRLAIQSRFVHQALPVVAVVPSGTPVIVFPYGGPDSYWHDRADGTWGSYVVDEVIPQSLKRVRADGGRVAIGGMSMGGFGALNLARNDVGTDDPARVTDTEVARELRHWGQRVRCRRAG